VTASESERQQDPSIHACSLLAARANGALAVVAHEPGDTREFGGRFAAASETAPV